MVVIEVEASVGGVERESTGPAGASASTWIRFTSTHFTSGSNTTVYGHATFEDLATENQFSVQITLSPHVLNNYFGWYIDEVEWSGQPDLSVVKAMFTNSGYTSISDGPLQTDEVLEGYNASTSWSGHTHGTEIDIASATVIGYDQNNRPIFWYIPVTDWDPQNPEDIEDAVGAVTHLRPPYHLGIAYACETVSLDIGNVPVSAYLSATKTRTVGGAHLGFENEVGFCTPSLVNIEIRLLSEHATVLATALANGNSIGDSVSSANTARHPFETIISGNDEAYVVPAYMKVVGDQLSTLKWVYLSSAERATLTQISVSPAQWYYYDGVNY